MWSSCPLERAVIVLEANRFVGADVPVQVDPVLDSPPMIFRRILPTCVFGVSAVLCIDGCMVGPDYERPDLVKPDAWHADLVEGIEVSEEGPGQWWASFNDPVLVELIERTDRNNLDLRTMFARIDAARANYGIAASDLFPQVGAEGKAEWYRADGGTSPVDGVFDPSGELYRVGLDLGWELDIWGRVRRTMQASEQDLLAAIENWRDMLITVRAEVASTYINYRIYRARVELIKLAIEAARISLELYEQEYAVGTSALSDVLQMRSQLRTIEADLPPTQAAATQSLNQLSVLVGEAPGYLTDLINDDGTIPVPAAELAVGVPADVIRQRPDVRSAERSLASAVAEIGATEALLFPQFSLTGVVGFSTSTASELFVWSNRNWSIGPSFSWSILNWNQIGSQIEFQQALAQEALVSYESAVLSAYEDMENALVGYASTELARRDTEAARDDSLDALILAEGAYEAGTVDLESIIQLELQFLDSEYTFLTYQGQAALAAVSLYKAAGGDWSPIVPSADGPIAVPASLNAAASPSEGESP